MDYSSYESVDEGEQEPESKKKALPKAAKPTAKPAAKSAPAATKATEAKSTGSTALKKTESKKGLDRSSSMNKGKPAGGNQKTLGSFFGGKKG